MKKSKSTDSFRTGGGIDRLKQVTGSVESGDALEGQILGNYRVLSLLAVGGMGRVYRAERIDGSFQRQVAIKLVPSNLGPEYLQRFELERQILATLSHPNIAHLYDAGVTDDNSLYLVMELISGDSIDVYCEKQSLSISAKTRLVLHLCEALAFAHSKLIIHRDVKPSNVLISENGDIKLLDFGISKILESPEGLTAHNRPMTPKYASPEQLLNEPVSVTSDIYQLGLLFLSLFEHKPSIETDSRESATERAVRKTSLTAASRLARPLPADLNAIIDKCLRADTAERYASAPELASDLQNYLLGYPVRARNPNRIRRAAKFLRRNWLPSSAIAVTFLSLVVFLGLSVRQQAITEAARELAEQQQLRASQTTDFLVGLFNANRPRDALGDELSARDILERGLKQLGEMEDAQELKVSLLDTISAVYRNLGDHKKALELANRSLIIKQETFAHEPLQIAKSHFLIGQLELWFGNLELALQSGTLAYRLYLKEHGLAHDATLDALYVVGTAHGRLEDFVQAEYVMNLILDGRRQLHGENHTSVTTAINNLAVLYADQGKYDAALPLIEEVLAWNEIQIPENHPWAAMDWQNYGAFLGGVGRYDEAILALQTSLAIREEVMAADHPLVAVTLTRLATQVGASGDLQESLALHQRAANLAKTVNEKPHPRVAEPQAMLGQLQTRLGDFANAETNIVEAGAQYAELYGIDSSEYSLSQKMLADLRLAQKRPGDALLLLEPVVEKYATVPWLHDALPLVAKVHRHLGNIEQAELYIDDAVRFLSGARGAANPITIDARIERSLLFLDMGRVREALVIIEKAMLDYGAYLNDDHWQVAALVALQIEAQTQLHQLPANTAALKASISKLAATFPESNEFLERARATLAQIESN
jgi:serine/threonine-protein kinase